MQKYAPSAFIVAVISALLLAGCTNTTDTPPKTASPTHASQPAASATLPSAVSTPHKATPSATPTGKSLPIKSLLPQIKPSATPQPAKSVPGKNAAVSLAASAVAHWKQDTVVAPDTNSWQQSGTTGTMRGTIITGDGIGQRYTFKLSKQGATWRIDSATAL